MLLLLCRYYKYWNTSNILHLLAVVLFIIFLPFANASGPINVVGPQKPQDASHDYFVSLLKMALAKSNNNSEIVLIPHWGEGRVLKILASSDLYDVVWTGVSKERDQLLHKVPIPLFKGGLGWRGLIIRKDAIDTFKAIADTSQLAKYIACQGRHWPDADILNAAGLRVQLVSSFDAMLQMVELRRCDYMPLSIFEGRSELEIVKHKFPMLTFSENLIISYPFTMNFYVKKNNIKLANDIEGGLIKLIESGEFDKHMKEHSLTKHGFPLERLRDATKIELKNHDISQDTLDELANYGFKWLQQKPTQGRVH